MDNGLQNSIARVLGGTDPNAPAGTAFLFAKSGDQQLWMTCHHVVRELSSLELAIYTDHNHTLTRVSCDYCGELSSVPTDVAVLRTKLEPREVSFLGLLTLPFGDPSISEDHQHWTLLGCGMQGKVERYPRGVPFLGGLSIFHDDVFAPPTMKISRAEFRP
jgi:hypothetical protein